jgi:hypothetical protein
VPQRVRDGLLGDPVDDFFWFGLTIAPSAMGAIALPVAVGSWSR